MGSSLSTEKYTLEIAHLYTNDDVATCCNFGEDESLYTNDEGLYVFKEKIDKNPKWLLYQGVLKNLLLKYNQLYLSTSIRLNEEELQDSSISFSNFYDLLKYSNNDIDNKMFSLKVVAYNSKNIKNDYISEVLE